MYIEEEAGDSEEAREIGNSGNKVDLQKSYLTN